MYIKHFQQWIHLLKIYYLDLLVIYCTRHLYWLVSTLTIALCQRSAGRSYQICSLFGPRTMAGSSVQCLCS